MNLSKNISYLVLVVWLICISRICTAQETPLNSDAWSDAVEGVDYFEKRPDLKPVETNDSDGESKSYEDFEGADKSEKNNQNNSSWNSSDGGGFGIPSWLSYFLMILIIGLLLFFILSAILKNQATVNLKNANELSEEDIADIEENLFDNDLERYIHEAKKAGNYKLAIRFSFIYIIRLLAETGKINWQRQKTNHEYLYEIRNDEFYPSFQHSLMLFENIWYGTLVLDDAQMKHVLDFMAGQINGLKQTKKAA